MVHMDLQRLAHLHQQHPSNYHNILIHKQKEICHTMVLCEVRLEKDDPDCTHITIGGNCICFPGDVGTNIEFLDLVKLLLNSMLS
jgi:hypothetical protein